MVSFFLLQHGLLKADVFRFVSAGNSSTAGGRTEEGEGAAHRGESVYQPVRLSILLSLSLCRQQHIEYFTLGIDCSIKKRISKWVKGSRALICGLIY